MKKFLTITIDVEPDCTSDWTYSNPLTFRGLQEGIGDILQPLFNKHGVKPTYLLNNVVMDDPSSVDFLKKLEGDFELGTHLHPEFIGPDRLYDNYAGKSARKNCCFYPPEIETAKLQSITRLFQANFGYSPTSFRAGRFSAGPNTMDTLRRLGYLVDTSVTPHVKWNDSTREGPVDFADAPEQPYFIKPGTITEKGDSGLLQVPVTIAMLPRNPMKELALSGFGIRRPVNWNRRVWLRPAFSVFADMKAVVNQYSRKYADNDTVVFNMMFHNVEVLPGLSPYTQTQTACNNYLADLGLFFEWCRQEDIRGVGLSDIHGIYRSSSVIKLKPLTGAGAKIRDISNYKDVNQK